MPFASFFILLELSSCLLPFSFSRRRVQKSLVDQQYLTILEDTIHHNKQSVCKYCLRSTQVSVMKAVSLIVYSVCSLSYALASGGEDEFNYRETVGNDFGPSDWNQVHCADHATCPGWPDDWESYNPFIPYHGSDNYCKECTGSTTGTCKRHKQSPIHLYRNVTAVKECKDRHWMGYKRGTCGFRKLNFAIERHTLRAHAPVDAFGNSLCSEPGSIDFSMGFPDRWHLVHTDINVPSEHTQDGKRYDAEVVLAHTYSKNKEDKLIGKVAIFLEKGDESDHYDFLQLYINRWRKERRRVRQACASRRDLEAQPDAIEDEDEDEDEDSLIESEGEERFLRFNRKYHPYDWMKKVETEYYFRYEGSQTVPPCLEEVHWRVMKDSIRVAPSQIAALEDLLATRKDPTTCKRETAGKHVGDGRVDVARPSQTNTRAHRLVFCECVDWPSKKAEDREWCKLSMEDRGVLPLEESIV